MVKIFSFLLVFLIFSTTSSTNLLAAKRYKKRYGKSKRYKTRRKRKTKKKVVKKVKKKPEKKVIPPKIIHKEVKAAIMKEPVNILITIEHPESVGFVVLHYASSNLKDWQTKEMLKKENNSYEAFIPSDYLLKDGAVYYIEAVDKNGKVIATFKTKENPAYIETYNVKRVTKKTDKTMEKNEEGKKEEYMSLADELATYSLDNSVETIAGKTLKSKFAPNIISVISKNMILKTGAKKLIEILKYLPGFYVRILPSGRYSVSIRGIGKDGNILVMINGNGINNPYDSSVIFDMSTDLIERIEIIRGPGSSVYGTDAVVGVINIITTNNDKSIKTFYGTNNNYSLSSNYNINRRGINLNLSAGVSSDDGANQYLERDDSRDMDWGLTSNGREFLTQRWSRNGYFSLKMSNKKFKSFVFFSEDKRGTWVGPNYTATKDSEYKTDRVLYEFSYNLLNKRKYLLVTSLKGNLFMIDNYLVTAPKGYYSTLSKEYFDNGKITKESYSVITVVPEINFSWDILHNLSILTGISYTYLSMLDYDLKRNYKLIGEEYHNLKFDLYDDIKLNQNGKSRGNVEFHLQADYAYDAFKATIGIRTDYYSDFGLSLNPRLALVYDIFDMFTIKALYGQAFRAPTIKELYDNTDNTDTGILGNENLEPETVKTSELSVQLNTKKLKMGSNFFYNINENIIAPFDPDGSGGVGVYQNIGKTDDLGVEFETRFILNEYFNMFFNISWFQRKFSWNTKIWEEGKAPKLDDRRSLITDIPMRTFNFGFDFHYKNFRTFIGIRNVSRALNNNRMSLEEINLLYIPEYWSYDFNISYNITKNFLIYLTGIDLGETHYASPSLLGDNVAVFGKKGLIQPKYSFRLGITYRFDFERN